MKPISNTAFYCCGIRMLDAESRKPICDDRYARSFMDERGMEIFRRFGGELGPNTSNVARHRYIDDYLRNRIATQPDIRIVLIGCGFDSRAFRIHGGEWLEFDEPQLIEYKNTRLPPSSCNNKLQRVAIDFGAESLADKLAPFTTDRLTLFIVEGVTMYLPDGALEGTLRTLKSLFPRHEVVADLMTRRFIDSFGRSIKRIIADMGADMVPPDAPDRPFMEEGYVEFSRESIIGLSFQYRGLRWLGKLFGILIPLAANGYTLRIFRPAT